MRRAALHMIIFFAVPQFLIYVIYRMILRVFPFTPQDQYICTFVAAIAATVEGVLYIIGFCVEMCDVYVNYVKKLESEARAKVLQNKRFKEQLDREVGVPRLPRD